MYMLVSTCSFSDLVYCSSDRSLVVPDGLAYRVDELHNAVRSQAGDMMEYLSNWVNCTSSLHLKVGKTYILPSEQVVTLFGGK